MGFLQPVDFLDRHRSAFAVIGEIFIHARFFAKISDNRHNFVCYVQTNRECRVFRSKHGFKRQSPDSCGAAQNANQEIGVPYGTGHWKTGALCSLIMATRRARN